MKKIISFGLSLLMCFNLIFSTYSFAYETKQLDKEQIKEIKTQSTLEQQANVNKRKLKYLAIFIKFKDNGNTNHIDDSECIQNAQKIFNSDELFDMETVKGKIKVPSFKKYYEMQSYGKLSITTEIFPRKNRKVVSYEDEQPIEYYLKYSDTNPKRI